MSNASLAHAIANDIAQRVASGADQASAERALARWILLNRGDGDDVAAALARVTVRRHDELSGVGPVLVGLDTVQPEAIHWICEGWLPRGKLSLLSGDPKLGKSLLTLLFAAAVSTGTSWPVAGGASTIRGSVILLSAEDDTADTIVPRLLAIGADLSRIKILQAVRVPHAGSDRLEERHFSLEDDLRHLETAIESLGDVGLILIDPILSYVGRIEVNSASEVRAILTPLAKLAAKHKVAVLAVNHLNKNAGGPAVYRSTGSLAFTAVARVILTLAKDPTNPRRRLLIRDGNIIPSGAGGLAFTIETDHDSGDPILAWESEPIAITADEALGGQGPQPRDRELIGAIEFLSAALADGPVPSVNLAAEAEAADISKSTLKRAERQLGVFSKRVGDRWFKVLTKESEQEDHPHPAPILTPLDFLNPLDGKEGAQDDQEVQPGHGPGLGPLNQPEFAASHEPSPARHPVRDDQADDAFAARVGGMFDACEVLHA